MTSHKDPHFAEEDLRSAHRSADSDGLTGIQGRIQLAARNAGSTAESEQDAAIIESFISTLARIALSAAARRKDQSDQSG